LRGGRGPDLRQREGPQFTQLSQFPSWPRRSLKGHFDPFPPPRLNGRCSFSQPTSAGVRGNEKDAAKAALPVNPQAGHSDKGSACRPTGNAAEGMTGSSEAIDLRAQRREEGLRLGEFGELLGRREALDRRRKHGVRIGVAIGRAIKLRQRQRGAQFEAPRCCRGSGGGRRAADDPRRPERSGLLRALPRGTWLRRTPPARPPSSPQRRRLSDRNAIA